MPPPRNEAEQRIRRVFIGLADEQGMIRGYTQLQLARIAQATPGAVSQFTTLALRLQRLDRRFDERDRKNVYVTSLHRDDVDERQLAQWWVKQRLATIAEEDRIAGEQRAARAAAAPAPAVESKALQTRRRTWRRGVSARFATAAQRVEQETGLIVEDLLIGDDTRQVWVTVRVKDVLAATYVEFRRTNGPTYEIYRLPPAADDFYRTPAVALEPGAARVVAAILDHALSEPAPTSSHLQLVEGS